MGTEGGLLQRDKLKIGQSLLERWYCKLLDKTNEMTKIQHEYVLESRSEDLLQALGKAKNKLENLLQETDQEKKRKS